jgi:molybdopterin converting factor small subunit
MKTAFLSWLAAETGLKDYEISERLGQTLEDLFSEIESEYGRVAAEELDPRFVNLFLLSPPKK